MAKEGSGRVQNNPTIIMNLINTAHAPIFHSFKTHFQSITQFFALHLIQCASHVPPA